MTQKQIEDWVMNQSSITDGLVKKALNSTTNANDHQIMEMEIDGTGLDSVFIYHIYTDYLKIGGEDDNDSNDSTLFKKITTEVRANLKDVENIKIDIDNAEKGYWGLKISYEQPKKEKNTETDITEELINIKSKQELLKTLEEIIAHFDKWKFFQKWKCPTEPQKQTALIMINSFRKKFVWENKKYDVEFKVVITDRDTPEPKLMVFKTTLIDNVKMNITALKKLWDEVANEKKTINHKAYNNIYESLSDKLRIAVEDRKKGEFLKPEVVRFDPKIGSTVVNEVEDENIISIKLDYWILFRDLQEIDDKTIYSITDRLMENISFSK